MSNDIIWMERALQLAKESEEKGEVPVGAVLVLNDTAIGEGRNSPISHCDPTAHAEILALRQGATYLNNYRLPHTTLYVTLEPCLMCLGAIVHARVQRIVYGATDPKKGMNHYPLCEGGILQEPCGQILRDFFQKKRH